LLTILLGLTCGRGPVINILGWHTISSPTFSLAIRAVENLALEFVHGGPHSILSYVGSSKSPEETAAHQNP
jgi:hypothetical protein